MAISKDKKQALVSELAELLANGKMTAVANYEGTTVASLQQLRRDAREAGVTIKVVKNRLVRVAMAESKTFKDTDTSALEGQLVYAFSDSDEVMPAKVLDAFAKTQEGNFNLVAGFDASGAYLDTEAVKALAALPSREELIASVVATLLSPVHDVTNALSGNLHALLDGVEAKATA
jgi:large subunit ribosomal protein L10